MLHWYRCITYQTEQDAVLFSSILHLSYFGHLPLCLFADRRLCVLIHFFWNVQSWWCSYCRCSLSGVPSSRTGCGLWRLIGHLGADEGCLGGRCNCIPYVRSFWSRLSVASFLRLDCPDSCHCPISCKVHAACSRSPVPMPGLHRPRSCDRPDWLPDGSIRCSWFSTLWSCCSRRRSLFLRGHRPGSSISPALPSLHALTSFQGIPPLSSALSPSHCFHIPAFS